MEGAILIWTPEPEQSLHVAPAWSGTYTLLSVTHLLIKVFSSWGPQGIALAGNSRSRGYNHRGSGMANACYSEWEREVKCCRRVDESEKSWEMWRHFIIGREKEHGLLEGSQTSPARPPGKSRVKLKMRPVLNTEFEPHRKRRCVWLSLPILQ
jgi:hypothetical protein